MHTIELGRIRGGRNGLDNDDVPASHPHQQPHLVPIPHIFPPTPALNTNTITATTNAHSSTHTTSTPSTLLPHPYNLPLPPYRIFPIRSPWPILKTTTRRLLTTLGIFLSLLMTWWTYASLQEARKANIQAEISNLLSFRAECRDLMQGGGGSEKVEIRRACEEALGREIVVKRDRYEELVDMSIDARIHLEGIMKQGDGGIVYGGMEETQNRDDAYALQWARWAASIMSRDDAEALAARKWGDPIDLYPRPSQIWCTSHRSRWCPRWDLFMEGEFYNQACLVWDSSNPAGWSEPSVHRYLDNPGWSGSGDSQSLSGAGTMVEGIGMILAYLFWLLPIWVVLSTAWKQLEEKSGVARKDKKKRRETEKKEKKE